MRIRCNFIEQFATNEANDETMMKEQELEKEFTQMIIENRQIIFKVCYIYTTDEYTIEELSQETLLNLWRAYPRFRGESKLSTWIYRVAMNTCISYMRQASSRPQTTALPFDFHSAKFNSVTLSFLSKWFTTTRS